MASLKITLFASFQVSQNGRAVTDFATDKARALLAYLVVERQQPHRREQLATLLWPDQPDARARQSLRQALSHLRQALGDADDAPVPLLLIDRHQVQYNPQAGLWLDVAEFTALADACDHHHHRQVAQCLPCLRRLEALLALYPGDFLAGFSPGDSDVFDEWVLLKREWLHQRAMEALTHLADFYERRGDLTAARRLAQRQVQLEPWREEAHRQLMRLLAQDGQRSAALAQFEACRRALDRELGVAPTAATVELYTAIRESTLTPAGLRPSAGHLPPAATPFIGRAKECADLAEMLANPDGRLITLVGPGGIGKTRLAMQAAEAQVGLYPDGVYWVALESVQDPALIIPTIAQAIGFALHGKEPPANQLLAYLREKRALLALDNVEHLPAVGDVAAAMLRQAPHVTLLVTSRERLALREEWLFSVEGLAYTETAVTPTPEAAQLFIHSVQRAYRQFTPTPADRTALAEICRLVEGMPLALELAAAWVPDHTCAGVARALARDMDLLTAVWRNAPERQRSVQATFEHSWALLPPEEQQLFVRLTVFRGGFSSAAAQAVGASRAALARLAAKSLVRQVGNGRYLLHQLLRQFAAGKTAVFPAAESAAAGHAAFYLDFLAGLEAALKSAGQEEALAAIDQDIANVRQAWAWAVQEMENGDPQAAGRLDRALESLFLFYALRSWYREGAAAFARAAMAVSPAIPDHLRLRGELLARQARCLEFTAPPEEATALYQESLACFRAARADSSTALPLYGLGYMAHLQGDYDAACRFFSDSQAQYQAAGDHWGIANVQSSLCLALRRQGAFTAARQAGEESLALRRRLGDRRGIASSQNNLGLIYCALGDYPAAAAALHESVAICREIGHTVGMANAYTGLCHVAFSAQDIARAGRYQREALDLFRQVGDLWGVAIATNNLGQLSLENGHPAEAQTLFTEAVQLYRELGIKTGLTYALSNLGQAKSDLAETAVAAGHLAEALALAREIGERPIVLEVLARTAVLWAQQEPGCGPLALLAFALQQPELFAETRRRAAGPLAALQARCRPEETAVWEQEAARLDLASATATAQAVLRQIAAGTPVN